jgi:hypothetical protein
MRHPRFRLRTLILAVAVVGLGLAACHGLVFAPLATNYARLAQFNRYIAAAHRQAASHAAHAMNDPELADRIRARANWHERNASLYERATRCPWLPVPPGPPAPE